MSNIAEIETIYNFLSRIIDIAGIFIEFLLYMFPKQAPKIESTNTNTDLTKTEATKTQAKKKKGQRPATYN